VTGPGFALGAFLCGIGSRGSHCGAAAFAALSCGRDRVRWPCRWLPLAGPASGRAGRAPTLTGAAGSLVLRRVDRRGHKERRRRPAPAGVLLNENAMDFAYDCRFLLLMEFVCD
jgi:hypothetical protein